MNDLTDGITALPDDLRAALVKATRATDCEVAGAAALELTHHGLHGYAPHWPGSPKLDVTMRSLCRLAAFERKLRADEPSYLPGYVATGGFTLKHQIYDPYVDRWCGMPQCYTRVPLRILARCRGLVAVVDRSGRPPTLCGTIALDGARARGPLGRRDGDRIRSRARGPCAGVQGQGQHHGLGQRKRLERRQSAE
jgi:hypothetical protein